jgi:hypothetical protein
MPERPELVMALIPLPTFYNPDDQGERKPIEEEKFVETRVEVAEMFGGCVLHYSRTEPPHGVWWNLGILYHDELAALEVDIPNTPEAREQLRAYALDVLLGRFEQEAIYVKLVPVETMLIMREVVSRK